MANYQFSFSIIPSDYIGTDYDFNFWLESKYNNSEFINIMKEEVSKRFKLFEDHTNTIMYGKEEGVLVYFFMNPLGLLSDIWVRIHAAYINEEHVQHEIINIEEIFSSYNFHGWTDNQTRIEITSNNILKEIIRSRAFEYIQDPIGYLERNAKLHDDKRDESMLEKALEIIKNEIVKKNHSCVICSEDLEESILLGTRDGYLNVISTLLEQIIENKKSDTKITSKMLQLPTDDAWIVSTELYETKWEMINRLKQFYSYDQKIIQSIENDPSFN